MRKVPVTTVGRVERDVLDALAPALRAQRTLGDVLAWGRGQDPRRTVAEIVTQDEYTHDVVVGAESPWLVFDTT